MSEHEYSLREKKYAKTKIALTHEFIEKMKASKFQDISIKAVCEAVEVSEATFYNYFPTKQDVVFYFKSLMSLRMQWTLQKKGYSNPLAAIDIFFDVMAEDIKNKNMFGEFVYLMSGEGKDQCEKIIDLSDAEKYFSFPTLKGIEQFDSVRLDDLLLGFIEQAKKKKLIKSGVDTEDVMVALFSILIGPPLVLELKEYHHFKKHHKKQLEWLWKAIT